jgi:hypothetical protein
VAQRSSVAKGGRGVKAPYKSEMYRIPSPIKDAVMHLAESYRLGVWDGKIESLQIRQEQSSALLEQVQKITSDYEARLQDTRNWTEAKKLIEDLRSVLSSNQLSETDIKLGRKLAEKSKVER